MIIQPLLRTKHRSRIFLPVFSSFPSLQRQSFSTTKNDKSLPPPPSSHKQRSRLGIGGSKLSRVNPTQYTSVIVTALQNGVTTFESGHGGEGALRDAIVEARKQLLLGKSDEKNSVVDNATEEVTTLTGRFGYRTVLKEEDEMEGDVPVEPSFTAGVNGSSADSSSSAKEQQESGATEEEESRGMTERAVHNFSTSYVSQCLKSSPLVQLRKEHNDNKLNVVYMAHNPEAQGSTLVSRGAPNDEINQHILEQLTNAFVGLELGVAEDYIDSYGVCSNGLSLPKSHPLHLPWKSVLRAASDAVQIVHGTSSSSSEDGPTSTNNEATTKEGGGTTAAVVANLSTIQLPSNLLETNGLYVAKSIRSYLQHSTSPTSSITDVETKKISHLPTDVNIYITRPLTCYPNLGVGTEHPFKLVDYQIHIPNLNPDVTQHGPEMRWTNDMKGTTPPGYTQALNVALQHFDGTHLLEAQAERKLTTEERETLDGCRLLQSMMHDLDVGLETVTSFASYEEELYKSVVPLIHDTFEELDEQSASVLQAFFMAHGSAVRHAVAKKTRSLLKEGGEGVDPYDIPDDVTLQDFALRQLLKNEFVTKVIVGCPQPDHVLEAIKAVDGL